MPSPSEISDVLVAVSVLLVFLIAYFAVLYPQVQQALTQDTSRLGTDDKETVKSRLAGYAWLLTGVAVMDALVLLLISKAVYDIGGSLSLYWPWSSRFIMAYGSLMLVALFIFVFSIVLGVTDLRVLKALKKIRP